MNIVMKREKCKVSVRIKVNQAKDRFNYTHIFMNAIITYRATSVRGFESREGKSNIESVSFCYMWI